MQAVACLTLSRKVRGLSRGVWGRGRVTLLGDAAHPVVNDLHTTKYFINSDNSMSDNVFKYIATSQTTLAILWNSFPLLVPQDHPFSPGPRESLHDCIKTDCSAESGLALRLIRSSVNHFARSHYCEVLLESTVVYRYEHEQLPRVKAVLSFASTASDLEQVEGLLYKPTFKPLWASQVCYFQVTVLLHSHLWGLCLCMGIVLGMRIVLV